MCSYRTVVAVWTCKCGKTIARNLPAARCGHCKSAYMTTVDGHLLVTRGEWFVTNEYAPLV